MVPLFSAARSPAATVAAISDANDLGSSAQIWPGQELRIPPGNRRPPVHTPVLGLYACGCNAGSRGIGTELAATSGAEAADRVIQDRSNGLIPMGSIVGKTRSRTHEKGMTA